MALVGEMKYLTIGENTYSISAGAKTFIVTLTESNGTYTSDKTAEEIYTAFNAGDTVLLDCGSYVLLSSVYGEDNYYQANFYKSEASTGSFNLYEYMIVTNNGVTSVESNYYNTPVNNGSLVIQKNGSTVGTFSANSSSNITANITVPTKVSDLTNDSGYITTYTETDPTVPAWAKQPTKPSYVAAEVGALPDNTQIPSKTSDLVNDSGFITGYTETDPTVPAWAKAASKPTYTANEVGALPSTTVIPSTTSDLTNDSGFITLTDVPKEIFVVTITYSNGEYSFDKTYAEITSAYNSGKHIVGHDISFNNYYYIVSIYEHLTEGQITFSNFVNVNEPFSSEYPGHIVCNVIYMDSSNNITNETCHLAVPTKTSHLTNNSGFITASDIPEEIEIIDLLPTTTYSDIYTLWSAGKTIILREQDSVAGTSTYYPLLVYDGRNQLFAFHTFEQDPNLGLTWVTQTRSSSDQYWSRGEYYIPQATDIPTATSDLTNDSGFITVNDVPQEVAFAVYGQTTYTEIYAFSAANKYVVVVDNGKLVPCTISLVGSTVVCSHFENGSEIIYVVTSEGWTSTSTSYATTASLATVATSGSYNDLSNRPTVSNVQIVRWSEENN